MAAGPGTIVVLNGIPGSGKSSIAAAMAEDTERTWLNFGVDAMAAVTPHRLWPGIGLRPGGERPDLEPSVASLYDALYDVVTMWSESGRHVVVDVGHHDAYAQPLGILTKTATRLVDRPAYLVGVRCPVEVVWERRQRDGGDVAGTLLERIRRWEDAVHTPGIYDHEVDTSTSTPAACAASVLEVVGTATPHAFRRLADIA